jgi:1,4-alpha-glucan branching enzyme
LDTDLEEFGGHNRIDHSIDYFSSDEPWDNRKCSLKVLHLKEIFFC